MSTTFDPDEFRDSIGTVNKEGKRNWIYPIKPKGRYYNARGIVTLFYLAILIAIPFIKIDGHPFILLNVVERKFILFGQIFWPQDFVIFALAMITFVIFIALFTVAFGRIFCGWVCPQTIFMEMIFRKIEYWIEGDSMKQQKLSKMPWNTEKILKRGGKNVVFWLISFVIANIFLSYIIGIEELKEIVTEPVSQHLGGFISILLFSTIFFFVFAWFREQVCIMVCPYGRLQGVLLDKDSIVVAYDHKRGEERGKLRKGEVRTEGDCIDCKQCIRVCPTGIDIRNGTQLECVNCTACMDVCDNIMDKVGFDRGLIRYASENSISRGKSLRFTPRLKAYSTVLLVLVGVLVALLASRDDIETNIIKTRGTVYHKRTNGDFTNLYDVTFINKTYQSHELVLKANNPKVKLEMVGEKNKLNPESKMNNKFFLVLSKDNRELANEKIAIDVYMGEELLSTEKVKFYIPDYLK